MGCREKSIFDLNELPEDGNGEEGEIGFSFQPHKVLHPMNSHTTMDLFALSSEGSERIVNKSHASLASGCELFMKTKDVNNKQKDVGCQDLGLSLPDTVNCGEEKKSVRINDEVAEREEGEWDDVDYTAENEVGILKDGSSSQCSLELDSEQMERASVSSHSFNGNKKGDTEMDVQEESSLVVKKRNVKGIEGSHALKFANVIGKNNKIDEHKEAKLGKKLGRQTKLIMLEDVRLAAAPVKILTPKRQVPNYLFSTTHSTKKARTVPAENSAERQVQFTAKDQNEADLSSREGSTSVDYNDNKSELRPEMNQGSQDKSRTVNSVAGSSSEAYPPLLSRQGSLKQSADSRQLKHSTMLAWKPASGSHSSMDSKQETKKHHPIKKQAGHSTQYQDTSIERLLREVTNDKFWRHPEDTELQSVPGWFESVEEYVRVFEPLLFEECRAQLCSTWEEAAETVSRDANIMVRVKSLERRERGWYDVTVLPAHERKWTFKEGEVAVLSQHVPGAARSRRNGSGASENDAESEAIGRLAGTVRRHIPIDTRDPFGATIHFYVGDSLNSPMHINYVVRKLQSKSIWYLTTLGSLATTQREYVALHAFRRLNLQMQAAILKPSAEYFPKYEERPPAMPECFTQNFVDHLFKSFNGPQLSAIQWAAMHTAAGTSSGMTKKEDPWPFTLVQGPPGTGKTHTVWGMLNVIHLVQYQHYYTALLKTLAPESYKQVNQSSSGSVSTGSIDEVLQSMDQNLFRTLPKLCPKPRMLVCAPSNAATDELLSRVLGRGFIDGEMKVYRPDVARVGVDTQTRAAQAVSVERRTEQLLGKGREEIRGWMHQLKTRENHLSQQIASLQRELNVASSAGRSEGFIGVDPDVLADRDHHRDTLLQNLAAAVEGRDKVLVEMTRLFIVEGKFRAGNRFNLEEARADLEASFANEAEIVFTTVSSSGRKLFSRLTHGFDMIVIDEAAQASEVGVLPPLSLGAARCVLVGDPQQLPATVISKAAGTLLYSRSLFERFQQAGCPTILLSVQYRMHPQIRDFPSRYFYQGRLTDSESVANLRDEIYYKDPLLRPYVFYDVTHGRESHRDGSVSFQNIHEAQFCFRIYEHLQKTLKSLGANRVSIGIITPYKLQLKCLKREFQDVLNSEEGKELYINTVDAFQGQERDVIIMSCVRASNHGVGFVADIRRMNVALTRARRALWVMGNANALMKSDDWAALITDAKARNCYLDIESLPKDFLNVKAPAYTQLTMKELKPLQSSSMRVNCSEKLPSMGLKHPVFNRVKSLNDIESSNRLHVRTQSTGPVAYNLEDVQAATGNFATNFLLGEGSLGQVYRAKFADGKVLTVKKMDCYLLQDKDAEDFTEMISDISKLQNSNITELVGYCFEQGHNLLIYDYFRNGSLNGFLHLSDVYRNPLTWNTRVTIALGTAMAMEYLHEVCSPSVVHKNIKSSNILLDTELNPHLSDCGLATFYQLTRRSLRDGYNAPECTNPSAYTTKADVYSFGVILLELLSGRLPFDRSKPNTEQSLVLWAIPHFHDMDALGKVVDPALRGVYPRNSLARFADVIALCVQTEPELRPPISKVVQALSELVVRPEYEQERRQ